MIAKKVETDITDIHELYDAVQMGLVEAEIGDLVGEKCYMYNTFHVETVEGDRPFFLHTIEIHNTSTGFKYVDQFVVQNDEVELLFAKHLKVISHNIEEVTHEG